jgi:hypothetical protein
MFTADKARNIDSITLDHRIEHSVRVRSKGNGTYMRVYHDDSFLENLYEELEKRGFTNIQIPDVCLSADVYFEW